MRGLLLLLVLSLVVPTVSQQLNGLKPLLTIGSATAMQVCTGPARSYEVHVTVLNRGRAESAAGPDGPIVTALDGSQPARWMGRTSLPRIPAGGAATVIITLAPEQPFAPGAPRLPFTVTIGVSHQLQGVAIANGSAQIATTSSSGCIAVTRSTLVKPSIRAATGIRLAPNGFVLYPTPRPPQPTHPQPVPENFIAPPTGLTYTTDPTVCVNHVGLLGALVCEQVISQSGLLLLVWNWTPCGMSNCMQQIDGYRIYSAPAPPGPPPAANVYFKPKATGHPVAAATPHAGKPINLNVNPALHFGPIPVPVTTPIDTQSDPTVTMRGIAPFHNGQCFVVTAYGHGQESAGSNTFCVGQSAFITAPWNVQYVQTGATQCYTFFPGQSAYQQCYVPWQQNHLVLTWSWNPCPSSSGCLQGVSGYNVYQTGGAFVAQQPNGSTLGVDMGQFQVGACYVVRAYQGNVQSDPSWPFCVSAQMVPSPGPAQNAATPMHVDISINDDTYPSNVVVHVGGSVTWHNNDTDEHNVVSSDSEIVGDLPPGESFTYTFPRTGVVNYHCGFHQGMQGKITVVAH